MTADLEPRIQALRETLRAHPLHRAIDSPEALRIFANHHVVCVFDFMSLLKSLQSDLSCGSVPWTPTRDPEAAHLILSIVLGEETDRRRDGRAQSHFVWYLEAMDEIGADTGPIRAVVEAIRKGASLDAALRGSTLPPAARRFGLRTASFLERSLPARAAVFFHGRESLIPELFLPIVQKLHSGGLRCNALIEYLERHIEVDGGEHSELAAQLLPRLDADDPEGAKQSAPATLDALQARLDLWDAIVAEIESAGEPREEAEHSASA